MRFEVGNDGNEAQNFWVDPPGYVDDIVWPRYVGDHSWLIIPDHLVQGDGEEMKYRLRLRCPNLGFVFRREALCMGF